MQGAAPTARSSLANGALLINGISVGAIARDASAVTQGRNAATAINAVTNQTGVTAVADASTGALTLTASDGRNIALTSFAGDGRGRHGDPERARVSTSRPARMPTGHDTFTLTVRRVQLRHAAPGSTSRTAG